MSEGLGTAPAKVDTRLTEIGNPGVTGDDEVLNWDFALENPAPARRSGRIEVTLRKIQTGPSLD